MSTEKQLAAQQRLREMHRNLANQMRSEADALSQARGCDDPSYATTPSTLDERQALWTNWREFARMVCAPLVERDEDEGVVQLAMKRFRWQSPYYLMTSLFMADMSLSRAEDRIAELERQIRVD